MYFNKIVLKYAHLQISVDVTSGQPTIISTLFWLFGCEFISFGSNISLAQPQEFIS